MERVELPLGGVAKAWVTMKGSLLIETPPVLLRAITAT